MALEAGQTIGGRYRLISKLGSGGMADVWLAADEMLDRRVALKFLHERFAQDAQFVERFRREAQSAAGLQHPNVVGVYDRGEDEGRHWIAMEYVDGAMLKDLIARGLSVGEAVEIVRQILAGARFAHARGIVHRDLKPQNVLVDSEGRARVTDFGIARAGASEITATGSVLGTAQYLSPEQAQGLEITPASDVYSIGVILYEALTGEVPFDAETPVAVALKQVSEQPVPPSRLDPSVPPALDAVVLRALAKDPGNRYASADEFVRALDEAEADPSGAALGDTARFEAVGAGAAAAAGAAALDPEWAHAGQGRGGWLTRRRAIVIAIVILALAAVAIWALTRGEQVRVPAVIDQPVSVARTALDQREFDVAESEIENCAAPGTVIEQDPPAGTEADEGSEVRLTVSLGSSVEVPAVRGETVGAARELIEEEDLLVKTREQASKDVDPGRVIRSEPGAGTEVDCESAVTLVVSKGPNLITLPDVLGDDRSVAESQLEDLGLIVDVDLEDADEPQDTVIGQDPGPGSQLTRGDRITLIVSTGAGSVIVPSVLGKPGDSAADQLTGLGLDVEIVEQEVDDRSDDDRVLEQTPSAGTRLRQGDSVTIFVGVLVEPEETTPTLPTPDQELGP
jgi:serine/threonine-protein kinase